ncbi:MAG: hypothetical protein AB7V42_16155 [Thermoleophilia bacterium]
MAAQTPAPPAPPARILVFAREFQFQFSRRVVPAGRIRLQLKNIGEDDHDLTIVGPKGNVRAWTGVIHPDGVGEIRARLAAGRYLVICQVADHQAHGMRTTLTVTAPKKKKKKKATPATAAARA